MIAPTERGTNVDSTSKKQTPAQLYKMQILYNKGKQLGFVKGVFVRLFNKIALNLSIKLYIVLRLVAFIFVFGGFAASQMSFLFI